MRIEAATHQAASDLQDAVLQRTRQEPRQILREVRQGKIVHIFIFIFFPRVRFKDFRNFRYFLYSKIIKSKVHQDRHLWTVQKMTGYTGKLRLERGGLGL